MCIYQYKSDLQKKCPYPSLYKKLGKLKKNVKLPTKLFSFSFDLLHDSEGICLFHSSQKEFKKNLRMVEQFKLLLDALALARKMKLLNYPIWDFDEFVFAAQEENFEDDVIQEEGHNIINLSDLKFYECATFNNCTFLDATWFNYSVFHKAVSFTNSIFISDADFSDVRFDAKAIFQNVGFNFWATFRNTIFKSFADFKSSIFNITAFNETSFSGYVTFESAAFSTATFTSVEFQKDPSNNSIANFRNSTFKNSLVMTNVTFDREVDFTGTSMGTGELIDVTFSSNKTTLFDLIKVKNQLVIKSLTKSEKTFAHLVTFDIDSDDINGQIIFENTNVYFIKQIQLLKAMALASSPKIVFGPGCDKYKIKKEFIVPMEEKWSFLIKEMADTFTEFFNWEKTLQISINVECEYFADYTIVRYFTDCEISEPEFEAVLLKKSPIFYEFLKDPQGYMRDYFEKTGSFKDSESIASDIDIYRNVYSLKTGIAARIKIDNANWGPNETLKLLMAISEKPDSKIAIEFNNYVINQKDFLSFGSKKVIATGDLNYNTNEEL